MKNMILKLAVVTALSSLANGVSAYTPPIYTDADVSGVFAPKGTIGPLANTLSITEAHVECMKLAPLSTDSPDVGTNSDFRETYKQCMADYVPFRLAGIGQSGSCPTNQVSWGECAATLPASGDGSLFNAENTFDTDKFEGFANFQCSGGQWQYVSGGCSAAVQSCEDGLIVDWGVTTPLWADESAATVFVDKFGVPRHTPKDRCYSRMSDALSGELVVVKPTSNEMPEPSLYDLGSSQSAQRCFNGEWLGEPSEQAPSCKYVPKSCEATTYDHTKGCTFNLPSGAHDSVFESKSPLPQNSVGGVVAHCWDGEWEIKSSSCEQSCESSVSAHTWETGLDSVSEVCSHSSANYSARISPGSVFSIQNQTAGLNGSASYSCQNGTLVRDAQYCEPLSCDSLPSNTWTGGSGEVCSHPRVGGTYSHGQEITRVVGDAFSENSGSIKYRCSFGEFEVLLSECDASDVNVDPICYADGVDPGTAPGYDPIFPDICPGIGTEYENGMCCSDNGPLGKRCSYVP